jgi:hypothetical protein
MKKLLITGLALASAATVLAQGTVQFNNRIINNISYVYYSSAYKTQIQGNGTAESVAGTVDWTGLGFTKISGSGYMAALLAAPSGIPTIAGLSAPTTTFRTGGAAGNVSPTTATLTGVAADAASAVIEMFAWDNSSGQYSSATAAYSAWQAGTIAGGLSAAYTVPLIGGSVNTPPGIPFTSFNIYQIPEPATVALAGLAASALLIFRRRK